MAVTLQKLMQHIKHKYDLTCMTGTTGMLTKVKWIYYMEDVSTLDFIRGGEMLITTGMRCKEEQWLFAFIEQAAKFHASAVMINTGHYIEHIPEGVIEFAIQKNIPVFIMPWQMHIVDLTQDICNLILLEKQKEFDMEKVFSAFFLKGEPLNRQVLEEQGGFRNSLFCILKAAWKKNELNKDRTDLERYLSNRLERVCESYITVCEEKMAFVFLQLREEGENSEETIETIRQQLERKDKTEKITWGISTIKQTFDGMKMAKEEAEKALFVARMKGESVTAYKDIGIYWILLEVKNREVLKNVYEEKLGVLNHLPKEEKQMYLDTLRSYIECNGSIQKVAEKNFLHRNTVNYRMKKLKEMLSVSLENEQEKFMLWLSFYIGDILKSDKNAEK